MPPNISDVDIGNKIVWNLMFVAFSAALALQICHSWKRKVYQIKTLISIKTRFLNGTYGFKRLPCFLSLFKASQRKEFLMGRAKLAFTVVCCLLAGYMVVTQISRFFENRDSSTIMFKRFNISPDDRYPTLSICFEGAKLNWYNETSIFESFGITSTKYEKILKGEQVLKFEYDYKTKLYNKIFTDIRNGSNDGFDKFYLSIADMLTGIEYATEEIPNSIKYGKGDRGVEVEDIPFYIGYQTPETICFTRTSNDTLGSIRMYDWLLFNKDIIGNENYQSAKMMIYLHYPGQLLRSYHTPVFKSGISFTAFNEEKNFWDRLLTITVTQVMLLRKRANSNVPCDPNLVNDDEKLQKEIIRKIDCIPIYWRHMDNKPVGISFCKSPDQYREAFKLIQDYKDILLSYDAPCVEMTILSKFDKEEENIWKDPSMKCQYTQATYQEIENARNFNFESFLSGVGGFVGIFMGYSLLQVPQMFISLLFLMRKLYIGRNKNEEGGRRKRKTTGPITKRVLKYDMISGTKWENN